MQRSTCSCTLIEGPVTRITPVSSRYQDLFVPHYNPSGGGDLAVAQARHRYPSWRPASHPQRGMSVARSVHARMPVRIKTSQHTVGMVSLECTYKKMTQQSNHVDTKTFSYFFFCDTCADHRDSVRRRTTQMFICHRDLCNGALWPFDRFRSERRVVTSPLGQLIVFKARHILIHHLTHAVPTIYSVTCTIRHLMLFAIRESICLPRLWCLRLHANSTERISASYPLVNPSNVLLVDPSLLYRMGYTVGFLFAM